MSTHWTGPFLHVFAPSDLINRRAVFEFERFVDELNLQTTQGKFEGGGFGDGSAESTILNRDNLPLVRKGDIALTFCRHPLFLDGKDAVCAIFVIEDEDFKENADGTGTMTWSGSGISKELQRKVLRKLYISETYDGTTTAWTDTYVFLDIAHQEGADFYIGGVIEIDGHLATIESYSYTENRIYVKDWTPSNPDSGGTTTYTIYYEKAPDDIDQAIANSQTGWSTSRAGTPSGSFHEVAGRKCIDLVNDIATDTSWQWATNITDGPLRTLFWFDTNAAPVDSFVYLRTIADVGLLTFKNNINFAPIIDCNKQSTIKSGVTRVLAAGADSLSFVGVTVGDLTIPTGFTLYPDESMLVYDTAEVGMSFHQIVEQSETFDYIKAQTDTTQATLAAQQRLLNACVDFLYSRSILNDDYTAKTIMLRNASIGQSLSLVFERLQNTEVIWSVDKDLWIRSFTCEASADNGVRYVTYDLGENWHKGEVDGNTALANRLTKMGGTSGSIVITGGGGSTTPTNPLYLLADGTKALTGNLFVNSGVTIDGIDISAHAADKVAHSATNDGQTNPLTILRTGSAGRLRLAGLGIGMAPVNSNRIEFGSAAYITTGADWLQIVPATYLYLRPGNNIVRISDVLSFETVGHITTLTENLNLTPAAALVFNPVGDLYLIPDTDLVRINNELQFQAPGSISTESGNLNITPFGSAVLNPGDLLYLRPTNNIVFIDNQLRFDAAGTISTISGALTINPAIQLYLTPVGSVVLRPGNNVVYIDNKLQFDAAGSIVTTAGDLTIAPADELMLRPVNNVVKIDDQLHFDKAGSITTESSNLNITPFGSAVLNPGDLLYLRPTNNVVFIDNELRFDAAGKISTLSGGDLSISPADDLYLTPVNDVIINAGGNNVHLVTATDIGAQLYGPAGGSGLTTQWKIDTELGAGYFAYLEADEMHIRLFQADVTMAKANGLIVTDSVAVLSASSATPPVQFQIPAVDATQTIYIEDNPALYGAGAFADGDWVRGRAFKRDGGLDLYNVWGIVNNYVDDGSGIQHWTFTSKYPGFNNQAVGMYMHSGNPILGYGKSGQGWMSIDARRDIGPFLDVGTWAGANPYESANRTTHLLLGNLNQVTSQGDYGFYVAVASPAGPRIIISDREASFHQIPISMYSGDNDGGELRIYGVELNSDISTAVSPNGDVSQENMVRDPVTGDWYENVDNDPVSPGADWISSAEGESGNIVFELENISHWLTEIEIKAYISSSIFVDDTCTIRAQIIKASGVALTDEVKLASENTTTPSIVTVKFTGIDLLASDAEWATARLVLTWIYHVSGGTEVIKLEPNMKVGPYIAVGNSIPESYDSANAGFWVGNDGGTYKLRIGDYDGKALLWDGASLKLMNTDLEIWEGTTQKVDISSAGNIKIGRNLGVSDIGLEFIALSGDLRIGDYNGANMFWDQSVGKLQLLDADLDIWDGAAQTIEITSAGVVKFGTNIAAATTTGFLFDASTGNLTLGADVAGEPRLLWNQAASTLSLRETDILISDDTYNVIWLRASNGDVKFGTNVSVVADIQFQFLGATGAIILGEYGGASLTWINTLNNKKLQITDGFGSEVISFKENGDSYFTGTMEFESPGEIIAGGVTLDNGGLSLDITDNQDNVDERISFVNSSGDVGYIRMFSYMAGIPSTQYMKLAVAEGSYRTYIQLGEGTHSENNGIRLASYYNIDLESTAGSIYLDGSTRTSVVNGLVVGNISLTPSVGQLLLDQGTLDGAIFHCLSSDVTTSIAQGQDKAESYFQIKKASGLDGGARLRGISDSNHGIWLSGSATDTSNTTRAPVILQGFVDNSTIAATDNVVAYYNNGALIQVTKGDGDLYIDGTYETPLDFLASDNEMVRAVSLLSPNAIRTKFDEFVRYNRNDLEEHRLIQTLPNGQTMINTTGMMRLHSGALWELHRRIAELEEQIGDLYRRYIQN